MVLLSSDLCLKCQEDLGDSGESFRCTKCDLWIHIKCMKLSRHESKLLKSSQKLSYFCFRCDTSCLCDSQIKALTSQLTLNGDELRRISDAITTLQQDIATLNEVSLRLNVVENKLKDALSPNGSISSGIISEINDQRRRETNVILYNIPESSSTDYNERRLHDLNFISSTLENTVSTANDMKLFRLGKPAVNKVRPLKVVFQNRNEAMAVLLQSDRLKAKGISVSRDRTPLERQALHEVRNELKARESDGETDLTIKFVNGVPRVINKPSKN